MWPSQSSIKAPSRLHNPALACLHNVPFCACPCLLRSLTFLLCLLLFPLHHQHCSYCHSYDNDNRPSAPRDPHWHPQPIRFPGKVPYSWSVAVPKQRSTFFFPFSGLGLFRYTLAPPLHPGSPSKMVEVGDRVWAGEKGSWPFVHGPILPARWSEVLPSSSSLFLISCQATNSHFFFIQK